MNHVARPLTRRNKKAIVALCVLSAIWIAFVAVKFAASNLHASERAHPTQAFKDTFTIQAETISIRVNGDRALFEKHAGQILTRIDSIDPALIRPGVRIWAESEQGAIWPPENEGLVLIGHVAEVTPRSP